MAELTIAAQGSAAERVRAEVERALTDQHVNLASQAGRDQAETAIEEALRAYQAEALASGNGDGAVAPELLERIRRELRDDLIGLGATLQRMLSDPDAQEWSINSPTRVFRDNGERIERVTEIVFPDDRAVRNLIERALEGVEGKRLDRITPIIEARLPDGSRLTAAIPPVSSNGHVICNIRLHRLKANTLAELVALEMLSQQAADFLAACVRARKNIVVSGPAGAGKTTLLNALGQAIPGSQRVVVCEAGAELKLPELLHNCVGYEARPESPDGLAAIDLRQLVATALRATPSRLIVGEVRGPEALAMYWAFASGHAGMTSVHGETCDHALRNLSRFALTAGYQITTEQALDWLREVHIVVHCTRPAVYENGEEYFLPRRVEEIVEVQGVEGTRLTLNPLFDGVGPNLRWNGSSPRYLDQLERAGFTPQ
ncbi:MAG: CpaF family protein [Acidobacteriota bacterium]|nr:CpaF family protein [Acidobacteriota bacterium]